MSRLSNHLSMQVQKLTPVSAVVSQNISDKSFLVCAKSEKYAKCILGHPLSELRPQGFIRQGKAKLRLSELTSVFYHLPSVGPK